MLMGLIDHLRKRIDSVENEDGALAVEYGVLIAFVAVTISAALIAFGGQISTWLTGLVALLP
jgi:Flp pilus assembly pilin Flp